MALYEGLVEYHPKSLAPTPALAERWDVNDDSSEFTFHIRRNGRWSNGDPIDANDFVYSIRRAMAKETASRNASLGMYIKYVKAYNQGEVFVRDPQTGQFLLAKDFDDSLPPEPLSGSPIDAAKSEYTPTAEESAYVAGNKVAVQVWLAGASPEVLAQLQQLGFEQLGEARVANIRLGRIEISKLAALAQLTGVRYITPLTN